MKFLKNSLFVFFALAMGQMSFAGHEGGHGGMVLQCFYRTNKKPIELFDYYQARTKWNIKVDLGSPKLDYMAKVDLALSRLHKLNPSREKLYKDWAKTFWSETNRTVGKNFVDTSDIGTGEYPIGCQQPQNVAYQEDPTLPGESRYNIKTEWFDQLDNDDKAGVVLHEIILREVSHQVPAQMDTKFVRYFNALISSRALDNMTLKTYIETLQMLQFATADAQGGIRIRLLGLSNEKPHYEVNQTYSGNPVEYWDDNTVKNAQLANGGKSFSVANLLGASFEAQPVMTNIHNLFNAAGLPNYMYVEDTKTYAFKIDGTTLVLKGIKSITLYEHEGQSVVRMEEAYKPLDRFLKTVEILDSNGSRMKPFENVASIEIWKDKRVIKLFTFPKPAFVMEPTIFEVPY